MVDWLSITVTVFLFTAIFTILGLVFKIVYWMASVDKDRDALKEGAEKDRATLQKFMREIREDIKQIFMRLPPASVAGSSPLRLTDFGERIAKRLKVHEWAAELAPALLGEVQGKQPFEIDEFCDIYVRRKLDKNLSIRVAKGVYEFGIVRHRQRRGFFGIESCAAGRIAKTGRR